MSNLNIFALDKLPLVSVVITCYNYGRFLEDAVSSAFNQSYKNLQVIVVNDGSTDNTDQVLNQYKDRITCINQCNSGAAAARNAGISIAVGTWILPLDADDWISPDYVTDAVDLIEDYKTVVFARYYYADSDLNLIDGYYPGIGITGQQILESCALKNISQNNSMTATSFYSKDLWKQCGGYNQSFRRAEDWEYNVNMISQGAQIKFMDTKEPYFKYRQHGHGKSTKNQHLLEHTRRFIKQKYAD